MPSGDVTTTSGSIFMQSGGIFTQSGGIATASGDVFINRRVSLGNRRTFFVQSQRVFLLRSASFFWKVVCEVLNR